MPIPALNQHGLLLSGVHECTVEEIGRRFGVFQGSDQRPQLFARLESFVREARASRLVECLLVNGSFVTGEPGPHDIDLVVVLPASHDLTTDLTPDQYRLVSRRWMRQHYGFDVIAVRAGTAEYDEARAFFQQVRLRPGLTKGILSVRL